MLKKVANKNERACECEHGAMTSQWNPQPVIEFRVMVDVKLRIRSNHKSKTED